MLMRTKACKKRLVSLILAGGFALLLPVVAHAQSAIAGQVTDGTGAVLPGVTVEASSPALIEGTRLVVTDGQGRYSIEALRPGTYRMTFTMSGFSSMIREGITLVSNFTAPISVRMNVGAVAESITVTGESPLVDVQRTSSQHVLTRDVLDALPTGRNAWGVGMTLPGVTQRTAGGGAVSDVGGLGGGQQAYLIIHGSAQSDQHLEVDGMNVNSALGGGQNASVYFDDGQFQELAYETIGGTAESQVSGVVVNMIPKEGGNTFRGSGTVHYANSSLYASNFSEELRKRGLLQPSEMNRLWDYNLGVGGPIRQDRLWSFSSVRFWGTDRLNPLSFDQPGVASEGAYAYINKLESYMLRLTGQLDQKNKVSASYAWMPRKRPHIDTSAGRNSALSYAPSGTMWAPTFTPYVGTLKWTSTLTSRMLAEVGYSINHYAFGTLNQPTLAPDAVKKLDTVRSNQWNAGDGDTRFNSELQNFVGKFSYVTGSHSFKVGIHHQWGRSINEVTRAVNLWQQYRNGVPFEVQVFSTPATSRTNLDGETGFFVQDSTTFGRLTANVGLRYDHLRAGVPANSAPTSRFVPARSADAVTLPVWTDWSPRVGLAYDLFGNARTALKFSAGRYVAQEVTSYPSRYNPLGAQSEVRSWTDLNSDDIAQDNEIGATRNVLFGLPAGRNVPDPDLQRGSNMLYNVAVQHQLLRNVAVSAGYYRRTYGNFLITDNLLTTHADYTAVAIADPRGNGQTITVYNLSRDKLGQVSNFDTNSDSNKRTYNGYDVNVNVRFAQGGSVTAGVSSGLTKENMCDVDNPNGLRFCNEYELDIPFETQFKFAGSYTFPWDISASAVLLSVPSLQRRISYVVSRAVIPNLTLSSVTVRLNEPGSEYLPRLNQLDLKFGKTLRYRRTRIQPQLGIFNVTNADTVLAVNNSFGPSLNRVQGVTDGRVVRLGVQVDF